MQLIYSPGFVQIEYSLSSLHMGQNGADNFQIVQEIFSVKRFFESKLTEIFDLERHLAFQLVPIHSSYSVIDESYNKKQPRRRSWHLMISLDIQGQVEIRIEFSQSFRLIPRIYAMQVHQYDSQSQLPPPFGKRAKFCFSRSRMPKHFKLDLSTQLSSHIILYACSLIGACPKKSP